MSPAQPVECEPPDVSISTVLLISCCSFGFLMQVVTWLAFIGQSRSPNIVPFHMLGIVSCCALVTLSLRRAVFTIFDFKQGRDLEIGVRGHSRSLTVAPFNSLCMVSY